MTTATTSQDFTKEQLLGLPAQVEEMEEKKEENTSEEDTTTRKRRARNEKDVEESSSEGNDDDKKEDKETPTSDDQENSQPKQFERAIKYLYESFDFIMGEDGQLYWGDKGTHVMTSDHETLKNKVGVYAQPGTITTSKSIREDALFFVEDGLAKDVDNKKSTTYSFQPRVLKGEDDCIWIDSGQGSYNSTAPGTAGFIKITPEGEWEINAQPTEYVYFYRNSNVGPLEVSKEGHITGIEEFFQHVNVPEEMKGNVVAFIINAIISPDADQPLLFIQGQQGNGKTTTSERIKQIFFPTVGIGQEESKAGLPDSISDLNALLKQDGLPFYDNITGISLAMSDAICRVATGAGFSTRKLYSDSDLAQSKYRRPQIMTSVDQITMRPDLQTRTVFIDPPKLRENGGHYQLGSVMKQQWFDALPGIRASFLTLAAEVLKRKNDKLLEAKEEGKTLQFTTRLSDFEFTSMVCDEILIEEDVFPEGYDSVAARAQAQSELRQASVPSVIDFLINCDEIQVIKSMKAGDLLDEIRSIAKDKGTPTDYFPRSGRGLTPALNDNMEVLKEYFDVKIEISSRNKQKFFSLTRKNLEDNPKQHSLFDEETI